MGVITIGAKDFIKGTSISDNLSDGGYSNKNKGNNLLAKVGCLNPKPSFTDLGTNIKNNALAMTMPSFNSNISGDFLFVTQQEPTGGTPATPEFGASFYTSNPISLKQTDTGGSARTFRQDITDMVVYSGNTYVTSDVNIAKLTGSTMSGLDATWWSVGASALTGTAPHRLLVWDKKLWITDEFSLHNYNAVGDTFTEDVLDLSGGQLNVITAINNYEATGDMILATAPNITINTNHNSKILIWDGFSPTPNREIHTSGYITTFFNHAGLTYVFYNNIFGVFNGSGITPIRKLDLSQSISVPDQQYIYPQNVTSIGDTIYIAENKNILAYGPLYSGGPKIFYYPYERDNRIHSILGFNGSELAISSGTTEDTFTIKLGTIDVTDASAISDWVSNVYDLPSNSIVNKIEVLFESLLTDNDQIDISIYSSDNPNAATTPANGQIVETTVGNISQYTIRAIDRQTASVQLLVQWIAGSTPIRQIKIYYSPIEKEVR